MAEINEEITEEGIGVNIKNVGISEDMHQKLEQLVDEGYFSKLQDGYRLAASVAILKKIPISDHKLLKRKNLYDAAGVDENESFRKTISQIFPEHKGKENNALEKFADIGIKIIFDEIMDNDELDIKSLLKDDLND